MNIDRVAKAMTGGRPRAGFTARVMAPIERRPRPGFTARVMNRLDERPVARPFRARVLSASFLLVPAVVALAAGVAVVRASRVVAPAVPDAPRLARADREPVIPFATPAVDIVLVRRAQKPAAPPPTALPDSPPIYMIAALEGPPEITTKSIEPAACTIPALDGPAPLKVTDLPASAAGSQKESKEKS